MNKIELIAQITDEPKIFYWNGQRNCGRHVRFSSQGEIAVIAGGPLHENLLAFAVGESVHIQGRLIFNPNTKLYGIVAETLTAFIASKIQESFFQAQRVTGHR